MSVTPRRLGDAGPEVFPIALGCAAFSGRREDLNDDSQSIATIHAAIDRGVNVIDTADLYGAGHNEQLIGQAIRDRRERVVISAKFGGLRAPDGAFIGIDGRPASAKNFLTYTLQRLGVDHVDIYRPARLDPNTPIEDTIGAIADLVKAGYVKHVGLSEMGPKTIRLAHAVHPICDVQIEYSLMNRRPEQTIFPVLRELGIAATVYGVLAHGLLSGRARPATAGGARSHLPWFRGENFEHNQALVRALAEIAREKGVPTSQLAIAWVLAQGDDLVPVVGCRTADQLADSLGALKLALSAEDLERIARAVPAEAVAGTRYDPHLMRLLDSERPDV